VSATKLTAVEEYRRVYAMLSGLSLNLPIALMASAKIGKFEELAKTDPLMQSLTRELSQRLHSISGVEDYVRMSQAYEAYAEANFCFEMTKRGVRLERTPGTGGDRQKRPDFVHQHDKGSIYFEVKALEIADPLFRHKEIAQDGLEAAADLDARARTPGFHFSEVPFSGFRPSMPVSERIDLTIERINNTIKPEQLRYGPTVLVVDLGRLAGMPVGPSGLLPVFFHDGPPAESCVSGELWHIALGVPGERILVLPEFDGRSNLDGHLKVRGVLYERPELVGISFLSPRWNDASEILTVWNVKPDQSSLQNKLTLDEHEVADLLMGYSDGVNDNHNEHGWYYRVCPLRPRPT
jgi:hypothetical protein